MPHDYRMKRIIFLDFDGVLNTEKYQNQLKINGEKRDDDFGSLFDPESVKNLKTILDAVPDALLVVTSTWKDVLGEDEIYRLWDERKMPGRLYGLTRPYMPDFSSFDPETDDFSIMAGKGYEVKQWLNGHAKGGCRYVILDDMSYFLPEQQPYHVKVDAFNGITKDNVAEALSILNA